MKTSKNLFESPQKLSAIKASLAIKQETVEKELDSILGDSPSPSKQIDRQGWSLVSPEKFALKLGQVEEGQSPDEEQEEMSSHDLTQEEQSASMSGNCLKTFVEPNREEALASQRDRHHELGLQPQPSEDSERPCSEIRLSFFSPTKL